MRTLLTIFLLTSFYSLQAIGQINSNWFGHYSGDLNIVSPKGKQQYHMEFEIDQKTDSTYTFNIIYGEGETRQLRPYELIEKSENEFILDEKNSILIEMTLFDNRLISTFEVQGSVLQAQYIFEKKQMRFELTSFTKSIESGNTNHEGEEIPLVTSYKTGVFQSALLKKSK